MAKRLGILFFPKYAVLHNAKLFFLYWALIIVIVAIWIWRFIAREQWATQTEPKGDVSILPFVSGISAAKAREVGELSRGSPLCTEPNQYKYLHNDYDNYTSNINLTSIACAPVCRPSLPLGTTCVTTQEMMLQQSSSNIFVPTFFTDTDANQAGTEQQFLIPGPGNVSVAFSHNFFVDDPLSFLFGKKDTIIGDSMDTSIGKRVTTVLLNASTNKVARTFQPGELINLTVGDLLSVAKLNEFIDVTSRLILDRPYDEYEEGLFAVPSNTSFGAIVQGPMLRVTGASLHVELFYSNKAAGCKVDALSSTVPILNVSKTDVLCCMAVVARRNWITKSRTIHLNLAGQANVRTYSGLDISFMVTGRFAIVNGYAIFEQLTILWIWLQLPSVVIYLIATFMLGTMSTVYSRALHQQAGMMNSSKGIAARLMSNSSAFYDLKDDEEGVTKERLLQRFMYILKYEADLDANETAKLCDFLYKAILNVPPGQTELPKAIDISSFCAVCASNEPLTFQVLQDFFDCHRRVGILERCFQDQSINSIRKLAKELLGREITVTAGDNGAVKTAVVAGSDGSQVQEILNENGNLQASCEDLRKNIQDTLEKAHAVSGGTDEMMRLEMAKAEVKLGEQKMMPPQTLGDGTIYHGEWVGSIKHGKGRMTLPDGSIYEGNFEHGAVHGYCVYTRPNGAKYEGEWRFGKEHGQGREVSQEGAIYEGTFKDGRKSGQAVICFPDGSTYKGQVSEGKMFGFGRYHWSSGQTYEGEWEDDLMHGQGKYTWANGITYIGQYRHNVKEGFGVLTWPDGHRFEGEYVNNLRNGAGVLTLPDGSQLQGFWENGKQAEISDDIQEI